MANIIYDGAWDKVVHYSFYCLFWGFYLFLLIAFIAGLYDTPGAECAVVQDAPPAYNEMSHQ